MNGETRDFIASGYQERLRNIGRRDDATRRIHGSQQTTSWPLSGMGRAASAAL
jgi:hypothetical protein